MVGRTAVLAFLFFCGMNSAAQQPVVKLPYPAGIKLCTQGTNSLPSHNKAFTRFDLDLDTPNNSDEFVLAAADGFAYPQPDAGPKSFGNHVNIDHGPVDPTNPGGDHYFTLYAHLKTTLVSDGQFVRQGQVIGVEDCTGACQGDHIHFGLHKGNPKTDALNSQSVLLEGLMARDVTAGGGFQTFRSDQFICGIGTGHSYESNNTVFNPSNGSSGSTAIITGVVNGQTVDKAYVPLTNSQRVAVVNVDSTSSIGALVTPIQMPPGYDPNATAANQATLQVVVISYTSADVQIIDASQDKLIAALTSPVTQSVSFSGGSCMICGVLVDPSTNKAILDTAQGYLLLNLTSPRTFSPFIPALSAENFALNPNSRIALSPTYGVGSFTGVQAINLNNQSVFNYTDNVGLEPDAAAVDFATNIAVVPVEFSSDQHLINMQEAAFSAGAFSAPRTVFSVSTLSFCDGLWTMVSVESASHLLFLGSEFSDCAAVESLPPAVVSGAPPTPSVFHWGHMPSRPDGFAWNNGTDPHGIAVFTSVVDGKPYGFLVDQSQLWVAKVNLAGLRDAALRAGGGPNEVDLTPFVFFLKTQ